MLAKRKELGIQETDPRFHKAFITGLSSMHLRKTLAKFYNLETKKPDFQWEIIIRKALEEEMLNNNFLIEEPSFSGSTTPSGQITPSVARGIPQVAVH